MTTRFGLIAAVSMVLAGSFAGAASADEIEVKMLNNNGKGKFMLFEPDFIKAKVGDTIKFVPTNKGHNAEAIPAIWPEGGGEFVGELNKEVVLKIEKPGVYGIKCKPHYPMGMIALIVAGDELPNKDQLESYKPAGTAEKRYLELKEQVGK
ncbi:pseudoazurin [Hyphomicrobium sp. LHD-15]|uniref:pseudoazurin n=1 Tax=Hyphomicrobium sp. LHD-15 TaxID=3072142 RepID=UPI00280D4F9D|nr:pseudoazurin [Hyphomicrobium sp. LHD-15]MDQ8697474.1 pseudoazurin [Hyphomicrobium sp. LHD-15]